MFILVSEKVSLVRKFAMYSRNRRDKYKSKILQLILIKKDMKVYRL